MCALVDMITSKIERELKLNVARYKKASQSSTSSLTYGAMKAVDVDLNTCSYTRSTPEAWWQVDLQATYEIKALVIITPPIRGKTKYKAMLRIVEVSLNNVFI